MLTQVQWSYPHIGSVPEPASGENRGYDNRHPHAKTGVNLEDMPRLQHTYVQTYCQPTNQNPPTKGR